VGLASAGHLNDSFFALNHSRHGSVRIIFV
jgi:hypothetical protein